jgi:hypothetical protein
MKFIRSKAALLMAVFVFAGCSLKAKNIKPPSPYNFAQLEALAKFAQAAYQDDLSIQTLCKPFYNEVYIQTIPSTNNKYFLATSSVTKTQLISIAGTDNIENVLLDADQTQEFFPELKISLHRGFAKAARLVYTDVKPHLIAGYSLQITGHSLGGAEALILGMMLKVAGTPAVSITTFGQPKVTNQAGADAFEDLPLTRVVNQDDVIPALPIDPYRYIAPELVLLSGPTYSLVEERPFNPAELVAAWQALQKHQAPAEYPEHRIANYLTDIETKIASSQDVPYPSSLLKN